MKQLGDVGGGNTLGRYELLTPIAQGGMALVWAARLCGTRGFQKIVAVKTMLPSLGDDPQFEQMFLAEAELAARIKHPNVCEILDLGEEDDTLYIVMEWVNGEPLTAVLRAAQTKRPMPLSVATRVARDAALGLHAAHEVRSDDGALVGLVHRDVSPHNILVSFEGHVKIVDFGIAKATAGDAGKTQAGQMKGKVPYMAPEQARGQPVDRRTDVFALGVVLFQLVTQTHPFREKDDITTLRRICERNPARRASSVVPTVPAALDAAIAKALEKEPSKRFQTMAELAEALEKVRTELAAAGDDEDTGAFVQSVLGERVQKRRRQIKEAIRLSDERVRERTQTAIAIEPLGPGDASGSLPSMPSGSLQDLSQPSLTSNVVTKSAPNAPLLLNAFDSPNSDVGVSTDAPPSPESTPPPRKLARTLALCALGAVLLGGGTIAIFSMRGANAPSTHVAANAPAPTSSPSTVSSATAPIATETSVATTAPVASAPPVEETAAAEAAPAGSSAKTSAARSQPARASGPAPARTTATPGPTSNLPRVRDPGF